MLTFLKRFIESGSLFVWLCGGALGVSLLMIGGLVLLILVNGMGYFWPKDLVQYTLKDGTMVLGEYVMSEMIPGSESSTHPQGRWRIQLKVGNRDVYGLDFRWVDKADIVQESYPVDIGAFERREWGNFYGHVKAVFEGNDLLGSGGQDRLALLGSVLETTTALQTQIDHLERDEIGVLNYQIEQARLKLRSLELQGRSESLESEQIRKQVSNAEASYEVINQQLTELYDRLNRYRVTLVDIGGKEKSLPVGTIVKAWSPNRMSIPEKIGMYIRNFWTVLSEEPREANTEGGIFPAIFGTVMMVLIMSVAVVPFGVLAAVYLKEYAKQGVLTQMIR
ncbi:MAG TPA: phosphate ABC transporter, permease protein PstA, partial [Nitrospirales bacterium]|nr:phosphate ABC transporter, permease protein PstA [Nitrospirales bacterium]